MSYANKEQNLIWWPELGMGFHPQPAMEYQGDYWAEYRRRDATEIGKNLTQARVDFVRRHYKGAPVDIGIGGGRFVEESGAFGFDVNDSANVWLINRGSYCDPYQSGVSAITCWDSLEHIPEPEKLLANVREWLFVSLPIFDSCDHVLKSRHYKPGEHIWYWTHTGFINWCYVQGFELIESCDMETELGRDGIKTYAFKRR